MGKKMKRTKAVVNTAQIFYELTDYISANTLVSTKQAYQVLINSGVKQGIKEYSAKSAVKRTLEKYVSVLGDKWIEVVKDDSPSNDESKIRDRYVYSLKLRRGKEQNDLNTIKSTIKAYFSLHVRGRNTKQIEKMCEEAKKGETKKIGEKGPTRKVMEDIFTTLYHMFKRGTREMTFTEVREVIKSGYYIQDDIIQRWNKTLLKAKVVGEFKTFKQGSDSKRCYVKITSSPDVMMLALDQFYKETNEGAGLLEKIKGSIKNPGNIEKPGSNVIKAEKPEYKQVISFNREERYLIFSIGGICRDYGKAIGLVELGKVLHDRFGINVGKNELIDLARREEELELTSFKDAMILKDGKRSWEIIKSKYNPGDLKTEVLARIGMGIEEVKRYFPESILVSKITENDGIYKIVFDKSRRSWKNLVSLYRTFRGNDKILDEQVELRLGLEVSAEIKCVEIADFALKIEEM